MDRGSHPKKPQKLSIILSRDGGNHIEFDLGTVSEGIGTGVVREAIYQQLKCLRQLALPLRRTMELLRFRAHPSHIFGTARYL